MWSSVAHLTSGYVFGNPKCLKSKGYASVFFFLHIAKEKGLRKMFKVLWMTGNFGTADMLIIMLEVSSVKVNLYALSFVILSQASEC